jgi:hypothetical protein
MFACFEFIHQLANFDFLELSKKVIYIFETGALEFIWKRSE